MEGKVGALPPLIQNLRKCSEEGIQNLNWISNFQMEHLQSNQSKLPGRKENARIARCQGPKSGKNCSTLQNCHPHQLPYTPIRHRKTIHQNPTSTAPQNSKLERPAKPNYPLPDTETAAWDPRATAAAAAPGSGPDKRPREAHSLPRSLLTSAAAAAVRCGAPKQLGDEGEEEENATTQAGWAVARAPRGLLNSGA